MPALRLREVQLPELHLPEMSRDDIVRVIGDVDLRRLDPRQMDLPEIDLSRVDLPKVDLPDIDLPKAFANAVEAARIGRGSPRSRLPFVIGGLVTLGLVGFALLTSPMVRPRLTEVGQKVRQRIDARRAAGEATDPDAPHAVDAAIAVPIEPAAFADEAPADGSPFDGSGALLEGLGADPVTTVEPVRS